MVQTTLKNGQSRCKTILYFEVVTSIALILGIIVAYVFKPGVGMNIDISHLDAKDLSTYTERAHEMHTGSEFLLNIIPKTFTAAFANGDILQVLLIAILFGVSLLLIPKHLAELVRQALEAFRKSSLKLWDLLFV